MKKLKKLSFAELTENLILFEYMTDMPLTPKQICKLYRLLCKDIPITNKKHEKFI